MKNIFLILVSLLISINTFSQLKKISLDDAVLQQNRLFRADKMLGFQFIPNSSKYIYLENNYKKLMTASPENVIATEVITIEELNKNLGTDLKTFFGIEFKDSNVFTIANGSKYYEYNLATKSGKLTHEITTDSENATSDSSKQNIAFTEANNLFYINKNKEKIAITSNKDKNIVSGQTISRSEFGISGGIFWSPKSSYLAFYQKDETDVADYPLLDSNELPGKLVSIKYPMIGQQSEKPSVGIYNLSTKKTVFIKPK